jgi:hypothetical protein
MREIDRFAYKCASLSVYLFLIRDKSVLIASKNFNTNENDRQGFGKHSTFSVSFDHRMVFAWTEAALQYPSTSFINTVSSTSIKKSPDSQSKERN